MAREAAPFASRKCRVYKVSLAEASNGTIVLGAVLPRGVSLARSPTCFHSQSRRCISFWSTYPPFALGLPSPRSSFRPSIYPRLARSLPHLQATSFLLIYRSFWFSHRFHRNTTARERRTVEDRNSSAAGRAKGCDLRMEIWWSRIEIPFPASGAQQVRP